MFFRKYLPIGTAFASGFVLSYYVFNGSINSSILNDFKIHAAYKEPVEIVKYETPEIAKSQSGPGAVVNMNRINEIMRYGYPSLDNLRVFDNYVLSYDRRHRVANWVFEHLNATTMKASEETDRGKSEFKEDSMIHPFFRSTNQDYKGSGFDRGHLAAAANHRLTQKIMDDTFYLSNMAPQVGEGFNRDKWNDLEKHVRKLVKQNANVWVVTGPLYLPRRESDNKMYVRYQVIGTQNVAVPTHFFKIILCESKNGEYELQSYVMPNAYCPKETPLSNYLVPLDSIERAAGFIFFERLQRPKLKTINGKSS